MAVAISLTVGGFDLSVGSTASLANALVISMFVWHGYGMTAAILITLALCLLVGLFNSFLIVILRIPRQATLQNGEIRCVYSVRI